MYPYFRKYPNFLKIQCMMGEVEERPHAKNQLDSLIRFDRTQTDTDRQTDTGT